MRMMLRPTWILCAVAAAGCAGLRERDGAATARAVVARSAAAVVPVKVVRSVKMSYQGRELPARESESEVLGTVLDDTGLIVASYAAVDPASSGASARPGLKVDSEIKSVKLIPIAEGESEVPLKIVLRDKDLDLIFLRPEKATRLANLGLEKAGPELALMDDVIVVSRLGAVADRRPQVAVTRVRAVIDKPRRFYVASFLEGLTALGCPAFNRQGRLVGIFLMRTSRSGAGGGLLGGIGSRMLPVILPAADVLEDVEQIKENESEGEA